MCFVEVSKLLKDHTKRGFQENFLVVPRDAMKGTVWYRNLPSKSQLLACGPLNRLIINCSNSTAVTRTSGQRDVPVFMNSSTKRYSHDYPKHKRNKSGNTQFLIYIFCFVFMRQGLRLALSS